MHNGIPVIDTHQHFWDRTGGGYNWLGDEPSPINRTFDFHEVEHQAAASGVDHAILVQADNTIADTDAMLEVVHRWPRAVAVIGWAPLTEAARLSEVLDTYRSDGRVVGLRHLNHIETDPSWLEREDVQTGLASMSTADLTFDVVAVLPEHLASVPVLARRFPDLQIVIDHLAKPPIATGEREPWASLLAAAASFPNVSAKLSGLDTAADPADCTATAMRPYLDHALAVFGANRLMFGSDWPVSTLGAGYDGWWSLVRDLIASLSAAEQSSILSGTAERVYGVRSAH